MSSPLLHILLPTPGSELHGCADQPCTILGAGLNAFIFYPSSHPHLLSPFLIYILECYDTVGAACLTLFMSVYLINLFLDGLCWIKHLVVLGNWFNDNAPFIQLCGQNKTKRGKKQNKHRILIKKVIGTLLGASCRCAGCRLYLFY